MNSNSFILDNTVITSFGKQGYRICKIDWYEKRLGLNAQCLMRVKTGSRMGDNIIITKLGDGIITTEDIIDSWRQGKIHDLIQS